MVVIKTKVQLLLFVPDLEEDEKRYGLRSKIASWVRASALGGAFSIGEMEKRDLGL